MYNTNYKLGANLGANDIIYDYIQKRHICYKKIWSEVIFFRWIFSLQRLKKLSHHPSIQGALFTNKKKMLIQVTLSSNWRMCRHFDGDFELNSLIEVFIYFIIHEKWRRVTEYISSKRDFSLLKYCSRQIYAKDRITYI